MNSQAFLILFFIAFLTLVGLLGFWVGQIKADVECIWGMVLKLILYSAEVNPEIMDKIYNGFTEQKEENE